MKRLYYTDALKAAWMAREFGVELGMDAPNCIIQKVSLDDALSLVDYDCKLEVNANSLHILEPQVGDWLVEYSQIEPQILGAVSYCVTLDAYTHEPQVALQEGFRTNCGTLDKPSGYSFGAHQWIMKDYKPDYSRYKILQRQGKAFFMPEVENE